MKRSLISIGRANFAAAETDPSAAGAQGGGFTVTDYYKEYSQGIAWPVFAVHPTFYMAPQPLGYYCRWDGESNPIGFKSDGAERARKLREDALRFVKSRGGLPPGGSFNCWVYCRKIAWTGPSSGAERSMRPYYRPLSPEEVEKGKKDPVFKYNPKIPWGDPLWPNSTIQVHYPGGGNVMVHEIGHCLGAPDFYHCTEEHDGVPGNPALKWAYGPTGPAYCRWKYQAFVPPNAYPTVKTSGTYKLGPRSGRFPASAAKSRPDMFPGAPEKPAPMPLGLYVPTTHPNYMLYLEYCRDEKTACRRPRRPRSDCKRDKHDHELSDERPAGFVLHIQTRRSGKLQGAVVRFAVSAARGFVHDELQSRRVSSEQAPGGRLYHEHPRNPGRRVPVRP